jgi:hypothetical protein
MRNGDRPAGCNLCLERRNHTAVASQDVSKADRNELGFTFGREAADNKFRGTLCSSHYIRGPYRLVRRNHHEAFNAILYCDAAKIPCSKNIVNSSLNRMLLHHRHVLICGCVKNRFNPMLPHYLFYTVPAADVGKFGDDFQIWVTVAHLHFNAEQVALGLVKQD